MYPFTTNTNVHESYEPGRRVHVLSTLKDRWVRSLEYYATSRGSTWLTCLYS